MCIQCRYLRNEDAEKAPLSLVESKTPIVMLPGLGLSAYISMGGVTGFEVVRQRPELVKALNVIEPVGSPTDKTDLEQHFVDVPYLAVYGSVDRHWEASRRMVVFKFAICMLYFSFKFFMSRNVHINI